MEFLHSVFLGLVQGLTEFLPVSSSGHLVLFQQILGGFSEADLFEDIMLHLGTLVAVTAFCRHEVAMLFKSLLHFHRKPENDEEAAEKRLLVAVILAGIPTAILGFAIKATMVPHFSSSLLLAVTFGITTLLLILSKYLVGANRKLNSSTALAVGAAQGLSVLPGISRSGFTIVIGQAMGLKNVHAARFAFVLSIPAIIGAALFTFIDLIQHPEAPHSLSLPMVCGMIVAAIVGYTSLVLLTRVIENAKFHYFAWYTGLISIFCVLRGLGLISL
jgi:undecaprenyl-diphosphatase